MKYSKKTILLTGLVIILAIAPEFTEGTVQAEKTDKFVCFADSYVDSTNENSNYGSTDLKVSYYSTYGWYEITFLAFNVTGLPSDAVVTIVKLEFSVKSIPLDEHSTELGVWECGAFEEHTITWSNKPSTKTNDTVFVSKGTITEDTRWEFTLSNSSNGYEAHTVRGNGIYYFMLMTVTDNMWSLTLDSRDDAWNPPKLAVTYTYTTTTTEPTTTEPTTTEPTSTIPSGAIKIEGTLEDKDYIEYSFTLSLDDLLEIYLEINTSSIDIEISKGGKSLRSWSKISNQFNSKITVNEDGTYTLKIENPGTLSGGDKLKVEGYYLITPDAADQAQIVLSTTTASWGITFTEIICLSAVLYIIKKKKRISK